jgi:hypothetical protein
VHPITLTISFEPAQITKSLSNIMKSFVVSSLTPFPNIGWWGSVLQADVVIWDIAEHFEKMSTRNRYEIATSNGRLKLSIPLKNGRDQRTPMNDLAISNAEPWQRQHWRTLVSAYNRSPFFEYYAPSLEQVFSQPFHFVKDFNLATIHWLMQQIRLQKEEQFFFSYVKEVPPGVADLRLPARKNKPTQNADFKPYYQVFEARNGFLPNLSLLDLLFAEGTYTLSFLRQHF